jgi:hypothetical protein
MLRFKPKVDEFTLLRLEKDAQKLLRVDPFNAYQLLGMLSCFKGKINDMHESYKKALNLAITKEDKELVLDNYAASLYNTGYFSQSAELSSKIYNISFPVKLIESINDRFFYAGLFHQVANFSRKYNLPSNSFIFKIESFIDKYNIKDEQIQKVIKIAISVLHNHHIFNFHNAVYLELSSDESSTWLSYIIKVNRPVEEIVEMDYELACALAEEDFSSDLLLHFVPVYEVAGE